MRRHWRLWKMALRAAVWRATAEPPPSVFAALPADHRSTSFGCSNEREWTYFGDALFNRNLQPEVSLEDAFLSAKVTIGQWEARDGLTPSNPQGHFGPALVAKLAQLGVSRQARAAQP